MTEIVTISPRESVSKIFRQSMLETVSGYGLKAIVPDKQPDKK